MEERGIRNVTSSKLRPDRRVYWKKRLGRAELQALATA